MSILRRGRFTSPMDEHVMAFTSSMQWDSWLFPHDLDVDRAHVVMLHRMGHISTEDAARILTGLKEIEEQGFDGLPEAEDVHEAVESALVARVGEVGGRMHTARSRNDEVATCLRMAVREEMLAMLHALIELRDGLLSIAAEHRHTIMPGFTHLQHAQPTTLAHHMLAHEQALSRDCERMLDCLSRLNVCPLGSAAFASTSFEIDRELTSKLLGFDAPLENTMDAISSRDFAIEAVGCASMVMLNLSRLCEELVIWSTSEFSLVQLPDAYTSTSSIMPQKKNPDVAEIARAKSGTVVGELMSLMMIVKGLPLSYNRDLQEANPHIMRALKETLFTLKVCIGMLEGAVFNTERMRELSPAGFACATELANTLVRCTGIPFRHAHSIVGALAREGKEHPTPSDIDRIALEVMGKPLSEMGLEPSDVQGALDIFSCVQRHAGTGGPSPESTKGAIQRARGLLEAHKRAVREVEERVHTARLMLKEACNTIMGAE